MGPHKRSTSALMGGVVVGTCTLCTLLLPSTSSYVSPLIALCGGAHYGQSNPTLIGVQDASCRPRFALDPPACPTQPAHPFNPLFYILTSRAGRIFLSLQGTKVLPKFMPWRSAPN